MFDNNLGIYVAVRIMFRFPQARTVGIFLMVPMEATMTNLEATSGPMEATMTNLEATSGPTEATVPMKKTVGFG